MRCVGKAVVLPGAAILNQCFSPTFNPCRSLAALSRSATLIGYLKSSTTASERWRTSEDGVARLLSRRSNWYKSFAVLCDRLASDFRVRNAVIGGEIVCVDKMVVLNSISCFTAEVIRASTPSICSS